MSFSFSTNVHAQPAVGLGINLSGPESHASACALKRPSLLPAACHAPAPRTVTVRISLGKVHNTFKPPIDSNTTSEHIYKAARASHLFTDAASLWEVCPQAGLERPLRSSESIVKVMKAWKTADCQLVLKPGVCSSGSQNWADRATIQTKDDKWKKMAVTLDADKPRVYLHKSENGRPLETLQLDAYTVYLGRISDSTCPSPISKYTVVFKPEKPSHLLQNSSESCRHTFCFDTIEKRDAFFIKMSKRKVASEHPLARPTTQTTSVNRFSACNTPQAHLPQISSLPRVTASSTPFSSNGLIARRCEVSSYTQPQPKSRATPKGDGFTGRGLLAAHPRFALP